MRKLNLKEKRWIAQLLKPEFDGKRQLFEQIERSQIIPQYNKGFISLKFVPDKTCVKFPYNVRVPIEIIAKQLKNNPPIALLLHVMNGYIDELEIFSYGGMEIDDNFCINNVEYIINDELLIKKK